VGPVAAFSPWNFPALLTARKMAPAIAAGCSIIVKPPMEAPGTALYLARACDEAGIPPGVVNMVTGKSAFISRHLLASDIIRKVSLTGSVPIGQEMLKQCAEGVKVASMELGGHAPVLVFEDADIDAAAEICACGKCRNNGQVCIAASRFFVQESVAEQFISKFVEVVKSQRLGHGKDPGTDVGPLANRRRLETTEALVRDAVEKGAVVRCGGKRPEGFDKGFWYEPTVLSGVDNSMNIMTEEPFCPVAPIGTFTTLKDGLAKANATEFGLAGYVFTNNTRIAIQASEGIEAGMVGVNTLLLATAEIPFGGIKYSGYGREGGAEGILDYTVTKHINIQI
jgi:succinate-semialdehyde dehydrogenase/glutarate-semialdehyde dehydrogenase